MSYYNKNNNNNKYKSYNNNRRPSPTYVTGRTQLDSFAYGFRLISNALRSMSSIMKFIRSFRH